MLLITYFSGNIIDNVKVISNIMESGIIYECIITSRGAIFEMVLQVANIEFVQDVLVIIMCCRNWLVQVLYMSVLERKSGTKELNF